MTRVFRVLIVSGAVSNFRIGLTKLLRLSGNEVIDGERIVNEFTNIKLITKVETLLVESPIILRNSEPPDLSPNIKGMSVQLEKAQFFGFCKLQPK